MNILVHGIETLKADRYFDYIFSTSEIGAGKSDPKSYQHCLNAMGATAEEAVMFEDAAYSMKTAKEAGLRVVAVHERCKQFEIDEIRSLCDLYVYDLRECMEGLL
jgi:beta-phosphoglucomutase-like phosphatase (HAD superfamily)